MGNLGPYLRSARESSGIDIRDAAQQTRISIGYLQALEAEDFSKLPGEVFVRGFLKNYARFLRLEEAETLRRYAELKPQCGPASAPASAEGERRDPAGRPAPSGKIPAEPILWAAVICALLVGFLFASFPSKHREKKEVHETSLATSASTSPLMTAPGATSESLAALPGKLYLEAVALEDTWLLVRTDTSPQKKAVLKKDESLIWSADERFLISYGRVAALKLILNGEELSVQGSKDLPVRDLAITRTGIINQPSPAVPARTIAKRKPALRTEASTTHSSPAPVPALPVAVPVTAAPASAPPAPERAPNATEQGAAKPADSPQ